MSTQHKHRHIGDWVAYYGNAVIHARKACDGSVMGMGLLLKALPPKTQVEMIKIGRGSKLPFQ